MRKIIEYRVLKSTYQMINSNVSLAMQEGLEPYGNPFISKDDMFCQAVVRFSESTEISKKDKKHKDQ